MMKTSIILPSDPDEMISTIQKAENPLLKAFIFGEALVDLTGPKEKDFWYKEQANYISLVLHFVSVGNGFPEDMKRDARSVMIFVENPEKFADALQLAMAKFPVDSVLFKPRFEAWAYFREAKLVARAFNMEPEFLKYMGKAGSLKK